MSPGRPLAGGDPSWYETLSTEVVCAGPLSRLRIDHVRTPTGEVMEREVVEHDDAVAIVALLDDGDVVLLRHYRHPFASYQLEIPAGKLDQVGEEPLEAARRELREEAGLAARSWEPLVTFRNSAGWTDESTTVFLASGVEDSAAPDGFEASGEEADLEVVRMPLEAAVAAVWDATIVDAKTIIGLLVATRAS